MKFYLVSESIMHWLKSAIPDSRVLDSMIYKTELDKAPIIEVPHIFSFVDADNHRFDICGWDSESAQKLLEQDIRVTFPVRQQGSYVAYPGLGAVRQGVDVTKDS